METTTRYKFVPAAPDEMAAAQPPAEAPPLSDAMIRSSELNRKVLETQLPLTEADWHKHLAQHFYAELPKND